MAPETMAQVMVERFVRFDVKQTLGDLADPPQVWQQTVTGTGIASLTEVKVELRLAGAPDGFASEMVVLLTKDLSRTSVLLNQVGVGVGTGLAAVVGFGYNGWDVTFADDAAGGDVHLNDPGSGILTGYVAPDGRTLPGDTARPWMLSVMNGLPGDGTWSLSVADVGIGGVMQLEGWSLTLKGWTPVPEPTATASAAGGLLAVGGWAWRRFRQAKPDA